MSTLTEAEATQLYLEFIKNKERAFEIKNKLKGTPFWDVVKDKAKPRVHSGGIVKKSKGVKKAKKAEKKK